jgi:hypothetical protein
MKTSITLAILAILAFGWSAAFAAERACRPSLSNWYHCPDTSKPAPQATERTSNSKRPCRPSLSNLWTCPGTSKARQRTARPDTSAERSRPAEPTRTAKPTRTTSAPERGCRPSLSNGFKCPPPGRAGEDQYSTERQAWSHCPTDTVVWANTRSNIFHFRGTHNYGATIAGAYMCEQDAIAGGMRAAKNETHP